jgi:HSP20 family protein
LTTFFGSLGLPTRFGSPFGNSFGSSFRWPKIELGESDKTIKVVAELPGMEQKDVDVSFDSNVLTIRGEKKGSSGDAVYSERWQRAFERSVQLSPDADFEKLKADFRNGILSVTIAKRPDARNRVRPDSDQQLSDDRRWCRSPEGARQVVMHIAKRQTRRGLLARPLFYYREAPCKWKRLSTVVV